MGITSRLVFLGSFLSLAGGWLLAEGIISSPRTPTTSSNASGNHEVEEALKRKTHRRESRNSEEYKTTRILLINREEDEDSLSKPSPKRILPRSSKDIAKRKESDPSPARVSSQPVKETSSTESRVRAPGTKNEQVESSEPSFKDANSLLRKKRIHKQIERHRRLAEEMMGSESTNIYLKPVEDDLPNIRTQVEKILNRLAQRWQLEEERLKELNPKEDHSGGIIADGGKDNSVIPSSQSFSTSSGNVFSIKDWLRITGRSEKMPQTTSNQELLDSHYPILGKESTILKYVKQDGWEVASMAKPPKEPHLVLQDFFDLLKQKIIANTPRKDSFGKGAAVTTTETQNQATSTAEPQKDPVTEEKGKDRVVDGEQQVVASNVTGKKKVLDSSDASTTSVKKGSSWEDLLSWVNSNKGSQEKERDPTNVISAVDPSVESTIPQLFEPVKLKLPPPELTLAYANPSRQWVKPGFGTLERTFMISARPRAIDREFLVNAPISFPEWEEDGPPPRARIPDPRDINWKKLYQWEGRSKEPKPIEEPDAISSQVIGVKKLDDDSSEPKVLDPSLRTGQGKSLKRPNDLWHKQIGDDSDWILDAKLWKELEPKKDSKSEEPKSSEKTEQEEKK